MRKTTSLPNVSRLRKRRCGVNCAVWRKDESKARHNQRGQKFTSDMLLQCTCLSKRIPNGRSRTHAKHSCVSPLGRLGLIRGQSGSRAMENTVVLLVEEKWPNTLSMGKGIPEIKFGWALFMLTPSGQCSCSSE